MSHKKKQRIAKLALPLSVDMIKHLCEQTDEVLTRTTKNGDLKALAYLIKEQRHNIKALHHFIKH